MRSLPYPARLAANTRAWLDEPVSIAPLVVFRLVFGGMMLFSTLRFWALDWIDDHFVQSKVQFKYFGFEWVQLLPPAGMYFLHIVMIVSALGILTGWRYRWSATAFFLAFTYTELIDLTYYLNHYYFVSIVSLLLIFVPANRRFSLDVRRDRSLFAAAVPRWTVFIFQLQLGIVYGYAGLAKINHDWLIEALPLRIWLPANDALPLVGPLLGARYTPWVFSWAGMLYDCTIVGWLAWAPTRRWAYATVVFFHVLTGLMFQIGVFPLVMIGATLLFFSEKWHERVMQGLARVFRIPVSPEGQPTRGNRSRLSAGGALLLAAFVVFQLLFPWRYLLYPGNLFWTEEGYRFSWRVMLMEKAGTATFYVKDKVSGREGVVNNRDFLNAHQEKQMAMQPDMILQFAHFLKNHYAAQGMREPAVRAEVHVTLNARPSRLLIDPATDLGLVADGWAHKTWLLPDEGGLKCRVSSHSKDVFPQ